MLQIQKSSCQQLPATCAKHRQKELALTVVSPSTRPVVFVTGFPSWPTSPQGVRPTKLVLRECSNACGSRVGRVLTSEISDCSARIYVHQGYADDASLHTGAW